MTDGTFRVRELLDLAPGTERYARIKDHYEALAALVQADPTQVLSAEAARRWLDAPPTKLSVSNYQLTRLLQYFIYADDEGRLPRPIPQDPSSASLSSARKNFHRIVRIDRATNPSSEFSGSKAFRGLSLGQLGQLCRWASLFYRSERLRRRLLEQEFVSPLEIGEFFSLRNDVGYGVTEARTHSFDLFAKSQDAVLTEEAHEHVVRRLESLLGDLKTGLLVHPVAFLARMLDLQESIQTDIRKEIERTKLDFHIRDGADWANITDTIDAQIHVLFLDLRFRDEARLSPNELVEVLGLDHYEWPQKQASTLRQRFRQRPWLEAFEAFRDADDDLNGVRRLSRLSFEQFHQTALWIEDEIVRQKLSAA